MPHRNACKRLIDGGEQRQEKAERQKKVLKIAGAVVPFLFSRKKKKGVNPLLIKASYCFVYLEK